MDTGFLCFGDFEFTCGINIARDTCELLSVGIVICDSSYKIVKTFYCTAKPVVHPKMTKQCVKLTKLVQQDIYNSPDSNEVMKVVCELMRTYGCEAIYVWGNFDIHGLYSDCGMHRKHRRNDEYIRAAADSIVDIQPQLVRRLGLPEAVNIAELSGVFGFVPRNGTYHNAFNDAMGLYEIHRGAYMTDFASNQKLAELKNERIAKREAQKQRAAARRREIALSVSLFEEEQEYLAAFPEEQRENARERLLGVRYTVLNYFRNHPDEEEYMFVAYREPLRFKMVAGSVYTRDKSQGSIYAAPLTKDSFAPVLLRYLELEEKESVTL